MDYLTPQDLELGRKNGLTDKLIKYRFYTMGWSKERAIKQPKTGLWTQYKDICQRHGISHPTFVQRMKKYGWTPEKAATTSKYLNGMGKPLETK